MIQGHWNQLRDSHLWPGIAFAFAIGFLIMPAIRFVDIALDVVFLLVGLGAFVAVIVRAGWSGALAYFAGVSAYTTWQSWLADFAGLGYLFLMFLLGPIFIGGACATIFNQIRHRGLSSAATDKAVWLLGLATVAVAVVWRAMAHLIFETGSPP